ncbi:MAG: glycosyltransferase [Candidatus Gottesmanbacteria bacterium]|nr:glycosyltransferase [Candidatus Gottesmanbacteria bacterium]
MRIGIDISQIVYEGTGVGTYVRRMVEALLAIDKKNDYILFGASLRRRGVFKEFAGKCAKLVVVPIPPTILSFLWNTLHILPVETFTGPLDVFWSSDWTQPPLAHAKGITTIHDLIALKFPEETHEKTELNGLNIRANIVAIQKRRLAWVKKECKAILCDSESTKKDVLGALGISKDRLHVIYPGI